MLRGRRVYIQCLLSLLLSAYVYYKEIVLYYGKKEVQKMPRLPNDGGSDINYRQIIGHLLRKPAAFAHYQYHESLFPRVIYRSAYDLLLKNNASKGGKQYLEVLNLAAITSESEVAAAIKDLIAIEVLPTLISIKELMAQFQSKPPELTMIRANLTQYDQLFKKRENVYVEMY